MVMILSYNRWLQQVYRYFMPVSQLFTHQYHKSVFKRYTINTVLRKLFWEPWKQFSHEVARLGFHDQSNLIFSALSSWQSRSGKCLGGTLTAVWCGHIKSPIFIGPACSSYLWLEVERGFLHCMCAQPAAEQARVQLLVLPLTECTMGKSGFSHSLTCDGWTSSLSLLLYYFIPIIWPFLV